MDRALILIGQPDSGKTNFLARLWEFIRHGDGELQLVDAPEIKYLEEVVAYLLQGEFAPRSDKNIEESQRNITLVVRGKGSAEDVEIVVPDVTGELWRSAVANSDLPAEWMSKLEGSSGALLFIRVGSEENHQPLDWVTSRRLLQLTGNNTAAEVALPTQVLYSELLRFLQLKLKPDPNGGRPRIAVIVTAWDRLDPEQRASLPIQYLRTEFPLLAGRLENADDLNVRVFGMSIVSGDLQDDPAFRAKFQEGELKDFGYVVCDGLDSRIKQDRDLSLPIKWLIER